MEEEKFLKSYFLMDNERQFNIDIYNERSLKSSAAILTYAEKICNIDVKDFVDYILDKSDIGMISSDDIYQYSNFEVAVYEVCRTLKKNMDGLSYEEVGKKLQDDGIERTKGANEKYGSNHFKLAENLGLAYRNGHKCYISALGMAFDELPDDKQTQLLTRLILRSNLIQKIIKTEKTNNGIIDLEIVLYDISEKTYLRRKPCIKRVVDELEKSKEYDFSSMASRIKY